MPVRATAWSLVVVKLGETGRRRGNGRCGWIHRSHLSAKD